MIKSWFRVPFAAAFILCGLFLTGAQNPAAASTTGADIATNATSGDLPINFSADQMDVDNELGIVTARGSVEVIYDKRTLLADTISYNQKSDVLTATGNIVLMEPSGDVTFAEHMEISGDFKNGIIRDIRMILSDRSRVAANAGRRINEDMELTKAVYSPCELCKDDPDKAPLWQLKAVKVFHDKSQQTVEYTDAWLEVAGVPVFYTPYLSHPDPSVKRKSGFLIPSFGGSNTLGTTLKTPYYWNIAPDKDATITPAYYSKKGAGISGEYRQRFLDGEIETRASLTDDDSTIEGHLESFGRFDLDPTWRWGFDLHTVTDDTYLRRYDFPSEQTLTNDIYLEGFRQRNYFRAESFYFRSLEAGDDEDATPLIAPLLSFSHVGEPDQFGGQSRLDASFVSLTREDGADTQRLSLQPGWEANYLSAAGDVFKLSLSLDTDLYYVQDHTPTGEATAFEGATGRMLPQAQLEWSRPFVKTTSTVNQVLEPKVSFVAAPNGSNPSDIPNEDSQEFEFDETSLFRTNKFSGHDRVEGGTRIDYGMHWGVYGESGGKTTAFIGQSYRLRDDSLFPENSGLEDNFSDIVASVDVSPQKFLNMNYRTRIDKSDGNINRNEISLTAGAPLLQVTTRYLFFERQEESEFDGREDISIGFTSRYNRFWRSNGSIQHDLADEDTRKINLGLTYEDECLVFTSALSRTFYEDRDLRPTDTILFTVNFKTLGGFSTDVF